MKNDSPYDPGPFRRVTLTDDQARRFEEAAARPRDLHNYMGQLATLTLYLNGASPNISNTAFVGMKYVLDETRAIMAATPARDIASLMAKCAAFENADPAIRGHRYLIDLGDLSIRADVKRLNADVKSPWLAPWYEN